jgi:hypothetical protein
MDYAQNCDSYSSVIFENPVHCFRVMDVTEMEHKTNDRKHDLVIEYVFYFLYNFFKRINTAHITIYVWDGRRRARSWCKFSAVVGRFWLKSKYVSRI